MRKRSFIPFGVLLVLVAILGLVRMREATAARSHSVPCVGCAPSTASGPAGEIQPTLDRIARGERFPSRDDGTVFQNREGRLPDQPRGYYREYVHPTPGVHGPGARRVITGRGGEVYFTRNHYQSFERVK